VAEKASEMMIHDARGAAFGLNSQEMRDMAELLDKNSDMIADIYADRAGGTREGWRASMRTETWYTSQEALQAGLVDEIAGQSTTDTATAASNQWDLSLFNFAGRTGAPDPVLPAIPISVQTTEPEFQFDPDIFRQAMEEAAR
jgi:ClpP class serine protease